MDERIIFLCSVLSIQTAVYIFLRRKSHSSKIIYSVSVHFPHPPLIFSFILGLSLQILLFIWLLLVWGAHLMEPYLFPECLICQVHAFGYQLRRGSLFCFCLAIPVTAAVPSLLCTLTYSCLTGCSETDTQELQREAGHSLFSSRFNSQAEAAADGRWRLNHQAHGCFCMLPFVK